MPSTSLKNFADYEETIITADDPIQPTLPKKNQDLSYWGYLKIRFNTQKPLIVDNLEIHLKELEEEFIECSKISNNPAAWNALTEAQKIANEKEKLRIMEAVQNSVAKYYRISSEQPHAIELKTNKSLWRKLLFGFLIVTDIALMSLGSYLGLVQILQLLAPALAPLTMTIIAGFATAIEALMMYSMFKPMLQEGLGIKPKSKVTLAQNYNKRLSLMNNINSLMVNNQQVTQLNGGAIYGYYAPILKLFNQDMAHTRLAPFKEPSYKKIGRYCLSALNIVLNIAGTYFGTVLLLTAISPLLLGTPAGWAIIGVFIVAQLLSRLLIRQNSLYKLLNPSAYQTEFVRKNLDQFVDKTPAIENDLTTLKKLDKVAKIETVENLMNSNASVPARIAECPVSFKPGEKDLPVSSRIVAKNKLADKTHEFITLKKIKDTSRSDIITQLQKPSTKLPMRSRECPAFFKPGEAHSNKLDQKHSSSALDSHLMTR